MTKWKLSRRSFLEGTAAVAVGGATFGRARGAYAAGRLSVGFWDHWVPGANDYLTRLAKEWAEKEKVDLQIDYIPSQGNKDLLTIQAESQAHSGHDILTFRTWEASSHAEDLEPVDDVMKEVLASNGKTNPVVEYLAHQNGRWIAVPATPGSQIKGPCSRLDLMKQHAGIDVVGDVPGRRPDQPRVGQELDVRHVPGRRREVRQGRRSRSASASALPPIRSTSSVRSSTPSAPSWSTRRARSRSSPRRPSQALDYMKRLSAFLPPDVIAWDDASNNRWLISGKGALIFNPPSAWAVAKRDAPKVAEQCWTHPMPAGPKGRFAPYLPFNWGIWSFSKNKSAAKSLLAHLSTKEAIAQFVEGSQGYDIPGYEALHEFPAWAEQGPPKGTLRHYPIVPGEQTYSIAASPAPPKIAVQVYSQATVTKMVGRMMQNGDTPEKAVAWAESELEGFLRT